MATTTKLTPVQKQLLLFLGTGGPAYINTGYRSTRCGSVTGGDRWITTNSTTLYFLEHYGLVVQTGRTGPNAPYSANLEHPLVRKLLGR